MLTNPLVLLIAIPLVIGLLNLFLPSIFQKILNLLSGIYLLTVVFALYRGASETISLFGTDLLAVDQLSIFALIFVQVLGLVILLFALKGVTGGIQRKFFILYPLTITFANGVLVSEHAISMLVFWGLSGMVLYLYANLGKSEDASQTARKTFLIIGGSDAFLILGLVVLATLQPAANWSLVEWNLPLSGGMAILGFICLLIAAFAKAGGIPLHTWIPDFSKDAPVESVALLPSSLDKILGIYLLARMMLTMFTISLVLHLIVITLGALTVITAVMMAMMQHNGRRLLGYHAVSQVGYMIMGVGSGSVLAFAGGLFHLINNAIYKSGLFLSLGSVEKAAGTNNLDDLGGLARRMPLTFIMALVFALSISGIPPFNGFFSKWMIYQGLLEQTAAVGAGYQLWFLLCIILAVFGSALTLASFIKFIHAIFLGKPVAAHDHVREAPANQWIATGILTVLCVAFGLFAVSLPLQGTIYPALAEAGLPTPEFLGTYSPLLILGLFGLAFLVGIVVYAVTRNVRYDETYLGGMAPAEKFRVVGTEFYNEIRDMAILRNFYSAAEKHYFDIYDIGDRTTGTVAKLLQRAHTGNLQMYLLYLVLGLLVLLWVMI